MAQGSYPGVYSQETLSGTNTIGAVPTSITAFVGYTRAGPPNTAVAVNSFADFERCCGGLATDSPVSYAVQQFFFNGGTQAQVVRVGRDFATALWVLNDEAAAPLLTVCAASPGVWGNDLRLSVHPTGTSAFTLEVAQLQADGRTLKTVETFANLNLTPTSATYAPRVVNGASSIIQLQAATSSQRPTAITHLPPATPGAGQRGAAADLIGEQTQKTGLFALLSADLFNLLSIPETFDMTAGEEAGVIAAAVALCEARRAFYIVDAPSDRSLDDIANWAEHIPDSRNAALYFPGLCISDPLKPGQTCALAPSGTLAGLYARTDASRGVWKAPSGVEATLLGVAQLTLKLNDGDNGRLNPLAINALRDLPTFGPVAWGARTLSGSDQHADEFKYIPVRRLALFIEESLYRGNQWVVFESNDEPLWAAMRLAASTFMHNLYRRGAFEGASPEHAYFVQCDQHTTTQLDRNNGVVNMCVGFAPLKPAEFVVLSLQWVAGQSQ